MCLGVPGKVVAVEEDALGMKMGKVSFGGLTREVCLAYTPDVEVDDWVIVHVGFAISQIDEEEAEKTLSYLAEIGGLDEVAEGEPQGGTSP